MHPDISEFSYGFALTNELLSASRGLKAIGAPVFPSLKDEGTLGFDVKLQIVGSPIFLQFKLSHWMVSSAAIGSAKLSVPHYRMHLRPLRHSLQHNLLMNLESRGNRVYYAAPEFHLPDELNDAFQRREVVTRSAFMRPLAIGRLPDDRDHFVSFAKGSTVAYRFSEPVEVAREASASLIDKWADFQTGDNQVRHPTDTYIRQIGDQLLATWEETLAQPERARAEVVRVRVQELTPPDRLAMLAHTVFACTVLFATRPVTAVS